MTVISKDQLQGLSSAKDQESAKSTVQPTASLSGATDTPNDSQQAASADQVKAVLAAVLQHDQDQSKGRTDTEASTHKDESTSSSPSKPSLERRSKQAQAAVQMQSTLLDKLRNPKPLSLRGQLHHMHAASAVH